MLLSVDAIIFVFTGVDLVKFLLSEPGFSGLVDLPNQRYECLLAFPGIMSLMFQSAIDKMICTDIGVEPCKSDYVRYNLKFGIRNPPIMYKV